MSLRLSQKHGVNPSLSTCYFCGEDKNEILLLGKLRGDVEAPHKVVWDIEPCDQCKEFMQQGIIVIGVENGQMKAMEAERQKYTDRLARSITARRRPRPFVPNPYRTGHFLVIREEAIKRVCSGSPKLLEEILQRRWMFIEREILETLGLDKATTAFLSGEGEQGTR